MSIYYPEDRERHGALDEVNELAHRAIGAAIEVHRVLGPGYLESVYEEALCIELTQREIPFDRQLNLPVSYKGYVVGDARLDLLIGDSLVLELKAVDRIAPIHVAQVVSYLKARNLTLGLIINFKVEVLRAGIKRVIRD